MSDHDNMKADLAKALGGWTDNSSWRDMLAAVERMREYDIRLTTIARLTGVNGSDAAVLGVTVLVAQLDNLRQREAHLLGALEHLTTYCQCIRSREGDDGG